MIRLPPGRGPLWSLALDPSVFAILRKCKRCQRLTRAPHARRSRDVCNMNPTYGTRKNRARTSLKMKGEICSAASSSPSPGPLLLTCGGIDVNRLLIQFFRRSAARASHQVPPVAAPEWAIARACRSSLCEQESPRYEHVFSPESPRPICAVSAPSQPLVGTLQAATHTLYNRTTCPFHRNAAKGRLYGIRIR